MNAVQRYHADIGIGGINVRLHTKSPEFVEMLGERYAGFMAPAANTDFEFEVDLETPQGIDPDADVRVFRDGGSWCLERGDFRAQWNPETRRGRIRQAPNPYSIDTVLRIVHTLVLAREGGMLMHSSSAVCGDRAFVFAGVSGVGKTTLSRLAPPGVHLLTDEMSFVRKESGGYFAYGTPFAGELARPGANLRAPLSGIFLLAQGPANRIDELSAADAVRGLMANILFFAQDRELVQAVFSAAIDLANQVPVRRLTFLPDRSVWDFLGGWNP